LAELGAALQRFVRGNGGDDGLILGTAAIRAGGRVDANPVEEAMRLRDVDALARLWAEGATIDWVRLPCTISTTTSNRSKRG